MKNSYSHDLFDGITREASDIFARYSQLSAKIKGMTQNMGSVQKKLETLPLDKYQTNPRAEYSQKMVSDAQIFVRNTLPQCNTKKMWKFLKGD